MADNRQQHATDQVNRTGSPGINERNPGSREGILTSAAHQLNTREQNGRSDVKNKKKYSRSDWERPLL